MAFFKKFNNPYVVALRYINDLIVAKERPKMIMLVILNLVNAILEVVSLAALIPILGLVAKPEWIEENPTANHIYQLSGADNHGNFMLMILGAAGTIFLLKVLSGAWINYIQGKTAWDIAMRLSVDQLRIFFNRNPEELNSENSTIYVRDINNVSDNFVKNIILPVIMITSEVSVALLLLVGLFSIVTWKIALLVILVMVPATAVIYRFLKNKIERIGNENKSLTPKAQEVIFQAVFGYSDVKLLNSEGHFEESFTAVKKRIYSNSVTTFVINLLTPKLIEFVGMLGVLLLAASAIILEKDLTTWLMAFGLAAYRIMPSINRILSNFLMIKQYSYTYPILKDNMNKEIIVEDKDRMDEISFKENLVIDQVGFTYNGAAESTFSGLNLEIRKGETIGIIGKSGSGKTTLINLILRFLLETEGNILVDEKKLNNTNLSAWRKHLGFVQQSIFILDDTLKANISFGEPDHLFDKNRALSALKMASLDDLMEQFDDPFDAQMGENGSKISGGQRQRLGVARALYHKADFLILDEATSQLDVETEKQVTEAIKNLSNGSELTVMLIAHRYSSLKYCNRILEMENGTVTREWTYEELSKEHATFE